MTWSKKNVVRGNHIDRISDLPSHIVDGILKHLNIQELVRTSILSRKWRYMWISVPQLCFDESFFRKCAHHLEYHGISLIITKVLLVHNGPIFKFTLCLPRTSTINVDCLNKWFLFLSRSGIKDLKLVNHGDIFQMPSHIFSCQELTSFVLKHFIMSFPPNFSGFKRLLDLHLYFITFESSALESLVSGCPLLQDLTLDYCSGFECIDFSAPTLKVLKIISYKAIKSICLKRANSLIDLTLVAIWDNEERGDVSNFITGLPKIQRLVMGPAYNTILSIGTIPLMLQRSFSSLEYLKLILDLTERKYFRHIVCLLESAPNLVELMIEDCNAYALVSDDLEELECGSCCLSQLRTVKIKILNRYQLAMSLIRLILANSSSLETLTFDVGVSYSKLEAPMLLSISQDLLLMERASQRVKIVFLHKEK